MMAVSPNAMASRQHPKGSLDYFPTPPWATRTLVHELLLRLGLVLEEKRVREPAAGGGHMLPPLRESFGAVDYSDVADWGIAPPIRDFTFETRETLRADGLEIPDWIITNPPYEIAPEFFIRAWSIAAEGVAMFVRIGWLAGQGRYHDIFGQTPPTFVCVFSERVPLIERAWDPEASSATDYIWAVWIKGMEPQPMVHFRPGMERRYSRPADEPLANRGEAARRAAARKKAKEEAERARKAAEQQELAG